MVIDERARVDEAVEFGGSCTRRRLRCISDEENVVEWAGDAMARSNRHAMEAVVVEARTTRGGGPDDGESHWYEDVIVLLGSTKWHLVLDVAAGDGLTFRHSGTHEVSNRLGGVRRMLTSLRPVPGLMLPVLVSADHRDVEVDWDAFVARGGFEQATQIVERRGADQGASELGKLLSKKPKMAARQRALILEHGPSMADEVVTGVRPADEFRRHISALVQGGALDADEGDDFLRRAGLL